MRIFRHYQDLPDDARGGVVVLGNFDGLHLGHQAVIGAGRALAQARGTHLAVMTFEPHPRAVFNPGAPPFRLTSFRTKAELIEALGVDVLVMQQFDAAFASLSAETFLSAVLVEGLGATGVICGHDYHFGKGRGGDVAALVEAGGRFGFAVEVVEPVKEPDGQLYSSTGVRQALAEGRPEAAARLLGRYWEIDGRVIEGDRRGRTIGFPTANLTLEGLTHPAFGVYAVKTGVDEGARTVWRDGVANIGRRPTYAVDHPLAEIHLLDFEGDLYHKHLRVALTAFLRPERKFDGLEGLKRQIAEDADRAREVLKNIPVPGHGQGPLIPAGA